MQLTEGELTQLKALADEDIYELYLELSEERGLPPPDGLTPHDRRGMVIEAATAPNLTLTLTLTLTGR